VLSFCLNGLSERTAFRFLSIKGIELIRGMAAIVLMVLQERERGGHGYQGSFGKQKKNWS